MRGSLISVVAAPLRIGRARMPGLLLFLRQVAAGWTIGVLRLLLLLPALLLMLAVEPAASVAYVPALCTGHDGLLGGSDLA